MNDQRIKRLILILALPAAVLLGACAKKPSAKRRTSATVGTVTM